MTHYPSPPRFQAQVAIIAAPFERALLDAGNSPADAARVSLERARNACTGIVHALPGDDIRAGLLETLERAALDHIGPVTLPADLDHVCDAILLALRNHERSAARLEVELQRERGDERDDSAPARDLAERRGQEPVEGLGLGVIVAHGHSVRAFGGGVEA